MDSRERWLAALRLQPLDRLVFWAKINEPYARAQAPPLADLPLPQLHEAIGSEPQRGVGACLLERRCETAVRVETEGLTRRTEYLTPSGSLVAVDRLDHASGSWHPQVFPIQQARDLRLMQEWFEDLEIDCEVPPATEPQEGLGTCVSAGTSPLMDFLQHLAGIAGGQYLLADQPREVGALLEAMHQVVRRRVELVCAHVPADLVYLVENTSTSLLSPAQFRRYCLPCLREYAALAGAQGRLMGLHMCGMLQALLPDLAALPVAAFEAFTTPTVGNTTLAEGRAQCPDKCLIGGTNAALWREPAEAIIAQLERDLAALPNHRGLILSSAGVMPPAATPATIRQVADWIHAYPARW